MIETTAQELTIGFNVKDYIKGLGIKECNECKEIQALQEAKNKNIKVAPLFWQGEGRQGIPLVIMGINPSVVGTDNEPKRGCDFESYFNYYQNRNESENENKKQARKGGFARKIPVGYWTRCQNLARQLIGDETPRWKNYVLMEAIHCFYDKESDLGKEDSIKVIRRCFDTYTKQILLFLKPKKMVLFGKAPYELLLPHLEKVIGDYEFCSLQIESLGIPVLRHPHPSGFASADFYMPDRYHDFKSYCEKGFA